jgi:hypothetical protein
MYLYNGSALRGSWENPTMEMDKTQEMTNRPHCQKCDHPLIPNPRPKDGEDAMRTAWWCNPCSLAQPRIEPIISILNTSVTVSA